MRSFPTRAYIGKSAEWPFEFPIGTFTGTDKDGGGVEVNGCDIFTFRDGKIQIKDSHRKIHAA